MLAGDLDAILQRALMRAPSQRYPSVDAFADDLRRWLDGQPVAARPQRTAYVARKFVARHRTATLVAAVGLLAVLAASSAAVVFGLHANDESQRAQATRDFMIALFDRANPFAHGGRDISAREMLLIGELEIERLDQQPVLQRDVLKTLSTLRYNFGDYNAAAVTQRAVSTRLEAEGAKVALVESLVEEARIAVARENWDDVQKRLAQADAVAPRAAWPAELRARADIQRGWYELISGRAALSAAAFESARRDAQRDGDVNLQAAALRGSATALVDSGDQKKFIDTLHQAKVLLDSLAANSRAHLSLVQTLSEGYFAAGRYQEGWPAAERMVTEVARFYSDPAAHVRQRLTWLRYCLKLDNASIASEWLEQFDAKPNGLAGYGTYTRAQWHAISARIWGAVGNRGRAAAAMTRMWSEADTAEPDSLRQFLRQHVSLAEAFASLSLDRPADVLRTLDSGVWSVPDESAAPFRSWARGVALARLGENEQAGSEFERSLILFKLPPDHPHVALVQLNLQITQLRLMGSATTGSLDRRLLATSIGASQSALTRSYGESNPASRAAAELQKIVSSSDIEPGPALAALALRKAGFDGGRQLFH